LRLPRWLCSRCGEAATDISWPANWRSTPALDELHAHLAALMTYRVAASVLAYLLPVETTTSHETLRRHTLNVGEQLRDVATVQPATVAPAISISLDSTFIRSRQEGEGHIEVRVGNVERPDEIH
jgi:hypothetical protein